MSAFSPLLGPQSDWCVPYLPLSQGQDSLWSGVALVHSCLHTVRLVVLLPWDLAKRVLGWIHKVHRGGTGRLSFAVSGPLQEGPWSTGREAGLFEGWIHRSTALSICRVQTSSVMGNGSLWNFGWGMRERNGAFLHLVPPLSSVLPGLNHSPSQCPLALPNLWEQSSCLLEFQMLCPADCQNSWSPAPLLLQARLRGICLVRWTAPPPLQAPPAIPRSMHHLSALHLLPWASSLHLALESPFCWYCGSFLGYLFWWGWNLCDQQNEVSPAVSYAAIFWILNHLLLGFRCLGWSCYNSVWCQQCSGAWLWPGKACWVWGGDSCGGTDKTVFS